MKQLNGQLEVTLTLSLLAGQHDGATFSFEQTEPPPSHQVPLLPNLYHPPPSNQNRAKARLQTG